MIRISRCVMALISVFVICNGIANATPSILWEDFNGTLVGSFGFNSSFVHVFGPHPETPDATFGWDNVSGANSSPENDSALGLFGASDYVTFLLDDNMFVSHISVSFRTENYGDTVSSILFLGETGSVLFENDEYIWRTVEADISEIGAIKAVQLAAWRGHFDDITLTVVPEPSTWALFICGAVIILSRRFLSGKSC